MRILITGVGNVGKSTLREAVAADFADDVIQVDMDYHRGELPSGSGRIVLVEDVHGLEKPPGEYDYVLYLKPMQGHAGRWLKRGRAWFTSGVVDLAERRGNGKPKSFLNLPLIFKIILKNILFYRIWVRNDLLILKNRFGGRYLAVSGVDQGTDVLRRMIKEVLHSQD